MTKHPQPSGPAATAALTGRERRGTSLAARVRRILYGLLLWGSQMQAAQAQTSPQQAGSPSPMKFNVEIQPIDWSEAEGPSALRFEVARQDSRLSPQFNRVSELLRLRQHNVVEQIKELQNGVGLDIELPDAGRLHLMLHPEEDKLNGGKRWAVTSVEEESSSANAVWSIGTSIDFVETSSLTNVDQRERKLSVSPQLIVDADQLLGMKGDAVVTIERAYWKSDRQVPAPAEQVVQLRLSWRF